MNHVSLRCLALATAAGLLTSPAAAHPGHTLSEHGSLHLVTSPFHIATLVGVGVVLWVASRFATHSSARRRLLMLSTVFVAAGGVFWGLGA